MSRNTFLGSVLWAAALASLLSLLTGDQQAVSIAIWLAGFSVWFAAITLLRLLDHVPLAPGRLMALVRRKPKTGGPVDRRPRELRSIEGLLIRARDNERAHRQQLQPRLATLADHFLPRQHGIDPKREPDRAAALLGDLAWIVDPASTGRSPTIEEVARFVGILHPNQNQDQERH